MLAEVPDHDKLVLFDRARMAVNAKGGMIDSLTPVQRQEFVRLVVEAVPALGADVDLDAMVLSPHVRPFFVPVEAPPDGLEPPTRTLGRCRSIH